LQKAPLTEPGSAAPAMAEPAFQVLADTGPIVTAQMAVDDWIALPDHPHHRNPASHASAVHLRQAKRAAGAVASLLAHVVAACWEGNYYKVDGHARGYLWETGELPRPDSLHATIYRVASRAELDALYEAFDTSTAIKTGYDQVLAGFRDCGLQLQSKRLRQGFLNDALNIALRGATRELQDHRLPELDVYRAVAAFKPELELLDGIDPQPLPFYSGVVAAALIGLTLFSPRRVLDFFGKLNRGEGNRKNGRSDPVDAVLNVIQHMTLEKRAAQTTLQAELCARTLRGLVTWLAGPESQRNQYWLKTSIHAINLEPLLAELKAKKGLQDDPTL
jgi:hypothetical protein